MSFINYKNYIFLATLCSLTFRLYSQGTITNKGADITNLGNLYVKGNYENYYSGRSANGGTIFIGKDIINYSDSTLFVTDTGRVVLNGLGIQNITGNKEIHLYDLTIDKQHGEVKLNNNIKVTDTLHLVNGNINLNGKNIDLVTKGTLYQEKNTSRVYGNSGLVKVAPYLGSPLITFNIAGLGLYMASQTTTGVTKIERGHYEQNSNGDTSIFRYYNIYASDSLVIDSIKINYFDAEAIAGESTYKIYTSENNGIDWMNKGGKVDTINNYMLTSTITPPLLKNFRITIFPIENFATCLPTDPNYISAVYLVPTKGLLNGDSIHFVQLTNPQPASYVWDFGDLNSSVTEFSPIHVYHLQVDTIATAYLTSLKVTNGICSDTRKKKVLVNPIPPQKVGFTNTFITFKNINLYPNPSTGFVNLEIDISTDADILIDVTDTQGKSLYKKTINATSVKEGLNINQLDSGIYYIKLTTGEDMRVLKMVKL
jgi:hypothetical protein